MSDFVTLQAHFLMKDPKSALNEKWKDDEAREVIRRFRETGA